MNYYDVIYHCDGNISIGLGHVFRGIDVLNFFITKFPDSKLAICGQYSHSVIQIIKKHLDSRVDICSSQNNSIESYILIVDTMFYPGEQRINVDFFSKIRNKTKTLVFFWDAKAMDIPDEVDIVINYLPYVQLSGSSNYRKFIGFDYLPVHTDFYQNETYNYKSGYILSVLGSTSDSNLAIPYLNFMNNVETNIEKIVLLSPNCNENDKLYYQNNFQSIKFIQNINNISEIIKKASVVVTTYGNTTFQVLASKIPVFTIAYQDFQDDYGQSLEDYGYSINIGKTNSMNNSKLELIFNDEYKLKMHEKLNTIFNSPGLNNIIQILSAELLKLKE